MEFASFEGGKNNRSWYPIYVRRTLMLIELFVILGIALLAVKVVIASLNSTHSDMCGSC